MYLKAKISNQLASLNAATVLVGVLRCIGSVENLMRKKILSLISLHHPLETTFLNISLFLETLIQI